MTKMKTRTTSNSPGSSYVPEGEVLYLRTSLLKTYLRCPAQCFFRYFKGLVVLPRSFLTMGSCTHKTAEYANRYKLKKGRDSKLSVLQDVFHEEFKDKARKTWWMKGEKPNDFEKEGVKKIVPTYREKIAKKVEPMIVEEGFKLALPGVNAYVTGTFDLVETNHLIRDLKVKGRSPNWMEAMKSFQGKSYRAGYKAKYNREPKGFMLDCIIRKEEPVVIPSKVIKPTQLDVDEFIQTSCRVAKSIRAGEFYPRREGNYFCSPNSCGFWPICTKGAWKDIGVFTKVFGSNESEDDSGGED